MKLIAPFLFSALTAHATLVTTSGSAANGDASISFSQTYRASASGQINAIQFPAILPDEARQTIRFSGDRQLSITVNGVPMQGDQARDTTLGCGSLKASHQMLTS